ncbi:MAG: hypothetical protein HY017_21790 [Betaproteobacteria bacterium]|nr:hypothetical protein [Betaproteobacteria bacterium]
MSEIATLTGMIAPEALGIVAFHEALLFGRPGWQHAPDAVFDRAEAFERILGELAAFRKLGGRTIVETSGIAMGRNVPMYRRLSELSGVNIVSTTGFVSQERSIPAHFCLIGYFYRGHGPFQWKRAIPGSPAPSHVGTKEYMMFLFYNELTEGMAGPAMIRTTSKAALVRCGSGDAEITIAEQQAIRGAAMAARKTGVPVFSDGVSQVERQFELLTAEGLPPGRIVIGHCDDGRAVDVSRDMKYAAIGAWIGYDHIGWETRPAPHAMPDGQRAELVKKMVDAGHADRVVLSCSAIGYGLGMPATRHGYSHLLESFVPRLAKAGVGERALHTMLVENPRRILTPVEPTDKDADRLHEFAQGFRLPMKGS